MVEQKTRVQRPSLEELNLSHGKLVRLRRLFYSRGAGNGTVLFLPYDQGLEHGPRDFFDNPASADPAYIFRLARDGNYSGIATQVGVARKYGHVAPEVPLILKINGKTDIPSDDNPISPLNASVEDAIAQGADAVGYTLYVGSPRQDEDFIQFAQVRRECEIYGMPLIVWSYPRGSAIEAKGGRDSLYAVDYAARVAVELGADVVKLNMPVFDAEKAKLQPKPYRDMSYTPEEGMARVVASAGKVPVLLSGGSKVSDEELFAKARAALEAGATGFIFGRNVWQREHDKAVEVTHKLWELLGQY
ncbi:MAG TPA: fructose-bisphosphate aldolase [Dehalococcoidia bacterium]